MKIVAIHQPNFIPWFPYFEKMNLADVFVILTECQFEKNGYQNRYFDDGKWVTNPVKRGTCQILEKEYTNGDNLLELNMAWIYSIAKTLDIKTEIVFDSCSSNDASANLAVQVAMNDGTHYLTNFEALDKYLKKQPFEDLGIELLPFSSENPHGTFEMFSLHGIEGCRKILRKQKERFNAICKQSTAGIPVCEKA